MSALLFSVAEVDGRWHYMFSGAGEVFSRGRPYMTMSAAGSLGRYRGISVFGATPFDTLTGTSWVVRGNVKRKAKGMVGSRFVT